MKVYKKAILPIGFFANGVACGIKRANKLDLALFYSDLPAIAACRFTANRIQAAPIKLDKIYLKNNACFRAVIVNSGNANCFTGSSGFKDAEETAGSLARALKTRREQVLVSSTGIIGRKLPLLKIKKAIPQLVTDLSIGGIDKAKMAIMTTDTFAKEITVRFNIKGKPITVCGIAKGAGMIAPNMATMLCFIFTDACITQKALGMALDISTANSFNCITVDGCMSTNDTVMLLANGAAENAAIDIRRHFEIFREALSTVCLRLAKMIVSDAEGATKFIRITVKGARDFKEAKGIALSVANSNLFKVAMYGQNPNFGRIVAGIGASGVDIAEKDIGIKVSPLDKKEIDVCVNVKRGNACAVVYTSDLTPGYIKINALYN